MLDSFAELEAELEAELKAELEARSRSTPLPRRAAVPREPRGDGGAARLSSQSWAISLTFLILSASQLSVVTGLQAPIRTTVRMAFWSM